jgi:hypothetical protein
MIPLRTATNMGNQQIRRMIPIMMTTTPMIIPNTFDTNITPFGKFS